jgi:hypothetical protein
MLLIDDLHVRVIGRDTGQLIRELILNPTRDYQPRGLPRGPPPGTLQGSGVDSSENAATHSGPRGTRTHNLRIKSPQLCQLS